MTRSVLLGVVLAGLLAGCSLGGGSGEEAVRPQPLNRKVAAQIENMLVPPFDTFRLVAVRCSVRGSLALCHGKARNGKTLPAVFRIQRDGSLVAVCVSPQTPVVRPNVFCAM
jgi:hypothetical protein